VLDFGLPGITSLEFEHHAIAEFGNKIGSSEAALLLRRSCHSGQSSERPDAGKRED